MSGVMIYIYIYIEMGSSYTWCNSIRVTPFLSHRFPKYLTVKKKTSSFFTSLNRVTPFLSHRFPKYLTVKKKTSSFFTSLNTYLINSIFIISLLIKYFCVSFFFSPLSMLCPFFPPLNKNSIVFLIFFRKIFTRSCKSFILYSVCIAFIFYFWFIQSAGSLFLLSI